MKAFQNAMERHEFQIVLMRPDPEMSHPPQRFLHGLPIRNKYRCRRFSKFHVF
jgi:hypothetical protein